MPVLPFMRPVTIVLACAALAACAAVQVRTVGTNTGQPAFDLSGPTAEVLGAEAQRLCPHGYAVMREWHRTSRPVGGAADAASGAAAAAWAFTYDQPPDQAQMSIVCRVQAPA
jgi:hypothetical protein